MFLHIQDVSIEQVCICKKSGSHLKAFRKAIGERASDSPRSKAVQKERRSSLSSDKKHSEDVRASCRLYVQGKPYRPGVEAGGEAPCKGGGRSLAMWRLLACEWSICMTARPQATASRYAMQGSTRKTDGTAVSATEERGSGCTCGYDHANPCTCRCEVWR